MQIFVNCNGTHTVDLPAAATVAGLKALISAEFAVPEEQQYLVCQGHILEEGLLTDAGVAELSNVTVGVRLLGGKVHGSLARAGKVKGQTPKVEKGEKKKKKTGRAKRRLQYNRRYVDVVVGPGKKRSPNSNST